MIKVTGLSKLYGKQCVLDNINITFENGRIYGLVGPNGCGKTTLMRCICGFSKPTNGQVSVDDHRIGIDVDFAPSTGVIIEHPGFLSQLSGYRNLSVLASISKNASNERIRNVIAMLGLNPDDGKPVGKYSLGMKQRLGIAQAILEDPQNLILDEPFNGLDSNGVREMHGLMQKLKEEGKTIILASHSATDIEMACDIVYEMNNGGITERR